MASQPADADLQSWRAYVQARAAATAGESDRADQAFAAAIRAQPNNATIAEEALRHALLSGNRDLAISAAQLLDRAQRVSPDALLVLLSDALRRRDWRAAEARIAALSSQQAFSFTAPVLRAWVAVGSRRGDPLAILAAAGDQLPQGYAAEQRALVLIAQGRPEGAQELLTVVQDHPRGVHLRVAGAAQLARRRQRDEALSLLQGDAEPIQTARRLIERRRQIPGAIAGAEEGIAEFLLRLSLELNSGNLRPAAINFARIATFMAPENAAASIIAGELLSLQNRHDDALRALQQVRADSPLAATARNTRVRLLATAGRNEEALAEALTLTRVQGAGVEDWTRLGDIYSQLERFGEAAEAYGRALAMFEGGDSAPGAWGLWMLRGGALERSGNWVEGKVALETAHRLAPNEPLALNYLGYAQLERRENLAEAERLIREAHRLAPDDASIADSLGWALFVRGNLAEAVPLLERAAAAEPADPVINEHLGDAYYRAGRRVEARFAWRAAAVYAQGAVAERLRRKIEIGRLTPETAAP